MAHSPPLPAMIPGYPPPPPRDVRDPNDPRGIITENAFSVAPHLLGLPLASPSRRAAAMAVDGVLIGILSNATGFLFGLAAAYVLFRISRRSDKTGRMATGLRFAFRAGAALVLFILVVSYWDDVFDRKSDGRTGAAEADSRVSAPASPAAPEGSAASTDGSAAGIQVDGLRSGVALAQLVRHVTALEGAADSARAADAAGELRKAMVTLGMKPTEQRELLDDLARDSDRSWVKAAAGAAAAELAPPVEREDTAEDPGSLVALYAAAAVAGDSARQDSLLDRLTVAVSRDTAAALQKRIDALQEEREELQEDLERTKETLEEEQEGFAMMRLIANLAEDLGLEIGWSALYFTAFLAIWRGQTPGKRLVGIRVIRLNGAPITWWAAFERFGGYAAGVVTGLLGFAQVYWDRNRQGVHDKISETVVVREERVVAAR